MKRSNVFQKNLFVVVAVIFWIGNYFFVSTFPTYCQAAGASVAAVGMIASAYGLSQLLVRVPLGIVSDRIGRRKAFIVALGFGCLGVGAVAMAMFPTPAILFLGRLFTGISASAWVSFTVMFAGYYSPEEGQKAIAIMTLTSMAGPLVANFFGGVTSESLGPAAPLWITAGLAVAGGLLSLGIREEKRCAPKAQMTVRELVAIGKERKILTVSLIAALVQFAAFGAGTTFAPLLAEQKLGANDTQLGILAAVMAGSGIPATLLAGAKRIRQWNARGVMLAGLLVNAASCAVFPFVRSLSALYLIQFISGFARNLIFPICMNMSIEDVDDAKKGSAMGFFQAIYSLGIFFGPLAMGNIGGDALTGGFLLSAVIVLAGAALVFLLPGKRAVPKKES